MTRVSVLAVAAIIAGGPLYAFGQAAPAAALVPKTLPSTATTAQTPGLTLRSLSAVLDARERRQDWHIAAEQAGGRIQDPALTSQFNQRLSGIVPAVAKLLIAHPQAYALVTVGVYRTKDAPATQAMVAVTLNGLDSQLGSDFFADVVAGLPQFPAGEGLPTNLSLDTEATSYLVFFLGEKQLEAGDIAHATFGKSIMLATNRVQKDAEGQAAATVNADRARTAAAQERAANAQAQANQSANPPTNVSTNSNGVAANGYADGQPGGYVAPANQYGYPYNYPLVNDGYYYPGIGVPIVILPGEAQATPQIQQRQADREHRLEKEFQKRAAGAGSGSPVTGVQSAARAGTGQTPVTGVGTTAQTPVAGVGTTAQSPTPGVGVSPGNNLNQQGAHTPVTFPQPGQPGGAPAGANAPATPARPSSPPGGTPSGGAPHPAAGEPGGAPASGAKK